jgi:hypothetical protein
VLFLKESKMNNFYKKTALIALFLPLIAACSGKAKDTLGLRRTAPDEFRVISNPPLSVPPEFSLRPPAEVGSGEQAATEADKDASKKLLAQKDISDKKSDGSLSKGENAFLSMAKTADANPAIKNILRRENGEEERAKENEGIIDKLSTYSTKGKKEKPADVVNAKAEKDRIVQNTEEGKPITEGETPTIDPDKKSVLQRIFGN